MSWSVNLYGHHDLEGDALAEAEKEFAAKVKEFAATLPGLGGGTINTQTQEQVVLQPSEPDTETAPDTDTEPDTEPDTDTDTTDATGNATDSATTTDAAEASGTANPTTTAPAESSDGSTETSSDLSSLSNEELQAELARRAANA